MDLLEDYGSDSSDDNDNDDKKAKIEEFPPRRIEIVPSQQADPETFVRSTPHIVGNWAGYIYAAVPIKNECLQDAMSESVVRFQHYLCQIRYPGNQLVSHLDHPTLHLSLSRHFALQLSSIESFVEKLQKRLQLLPTTTIRLSSSEEILVNDDKTRSFWTWPIATNAALLAIVEEINAVLKIYNQLRYDPPKFHVSLASVVGDIIRHHVTNANDSNDGFFKHGGPPADSNATSTSATTEVHYIRVKEIECSFGTTKKYRIQLKSK